MANGVNAPSFGIGVDIGGTKVLVVIGDCSGRIIFKEKFTTPGDIEAIVSLIKNCIMKANLSSSNIAGMGVGVPGRVNSKDGIVIDAPSIKWQDLELKRILQEFFNFPIFVKNDVNFSVIGEQWRGNGNNNGNIFYIAVGTGVGGAIIANGHVVEGANFSAGEVAYFIDKEDVREGRKNLVQDFGTFEKKTSGTALTEKGLPYGYSSKELFVQYRQNNPIVKPIIDEFVLETSIAIANAVSLLNPGIVIIGGGVSESMDCVLDKIKDNVADLTPIPTKIELSKLGGEAGALGGVAFVFQEIGKKI
jgi:glucokinase